MHRLLAFTIAALLLGTSNLLAASREPASPARGKQTFVRAGCYECHGLAGQGGAGAKLAPDPPPMETFSTIVRGGINEMPSYTEKVLPDADLRDIHAFLTSIPRPKSPDSIPVLRALKAPN
jgi:mono/diheme cytochrome c family protein